MTTTHFNLAITSPHLTNLAASLVQGALSKALEDADSSFVGVAVSAERVDPNEADAREQLTLAQRQIELLRSDLELIGNALKDEAVRRDWCSEYEAFVDEVNACTKAWDLPSRQRDYRVEHVYEVRIIGTVSAISDEDADIEASRQYRQIREIYHFLLPTDHEVLPDRGQLHEVTWHHEQSTTTPEED
jgi:hypothetical protein